MMFSATAVQLQEKQVKSELPGADLLTILFCSLALSVCVCVWGGISCCCPFFQVLHISLHVIQDLCVQRDIFIESSSDDQEPWKSFSNHCTECRLGAGIFPNTIWFSSFPCDERSVCTGLMISLIRVYSFTGCVKQPQLFQMPTLLLLCKCAAHLSSWCFILKIQGNKQK